MWIICSWYLSFLTDEKTWSTTWLVHFTLQEHLSNDPKLFHNLYSTIAEASLTYLKSRPVKDLSPTRYQLMICDRGVSRKAEDTLKFLEITKPTVLDSPWVEKILLRCGRNCKTDLCQANEFEVTLILPVIGTLQISSDPIMAPCYWRMQGLIGNTLTGLSYHVICIGLCAGLCLPALQLWRLCRCEVFPVCAMVWGPWQPHRESGKKHGMDWTTIFTPSHPGTF